MDSSDSIYDSWEELPDCLMNLLDSDREQDKATQFDATLKDLEIDHCLMDSSDSDREQDKATQFGNLKTKGVGQTTIM